MKLAFPVNEGWIFSKDRYTIKMFASYDRDSDTNEITFGDRTMIPISCVRKMKKLN
jgi:lipopolysaccharide assembly outer membrane protein LptD (OstA)